MPRGRSSTSTPAPTCAERRCGGSRVDFGGQAPLACRHRLGGGMKSTASAVLALLATTAAAAEPKVVEPDWVRQATEDEIFWAYPPEAVKAGVTGKAAIKCMVDEQGDPQLCVVVS